MITEEQRTDRFYGGNGVNCIHGTQPMFVCDKCVQLGFQIRREDRQTEAFDRFAIALDELVALLRSWKETN